MKIYILKATNKKAEVFNLESPVRMFNGAPLNEHWHPPRISRFNVGISFFDLMTCNTSSLLVATQHAYEVLLPHMGGEMEFLPTISDTNSNYFLINVISVFYQALDKCKSKISYFSSGKIMYVNEYAFTQEIINRLYETESMVFKIDDFDISPIFFTERFIELLNNTGLSTAFEFKMIADI